MKTILVVDDDKILRDSLARGLRDSGFVVISAESAESASEIMSRVRANAIVLDRMMTGMDGLTWLKNLRANGDETPVIMLTAMSGSENTIDGLTARANDYLAKPFKMAELILRLNNIMQSAPPSLTLPKLPNGFQISNEAVYFNGKLLALSAEEGKFFRELIMPMGTIVNTVPMIAKRLRDKINVIQSGLDLITIRGYGYKLICV